MDDLISRRAAIDALWKALYDYEDKIEKQFQESDDLDVSDWIAHRIFVQSMSDIDRQIILNLPSAQPEIIRCEHCKHGIHSGRGPTYYCIADSIDLGIHKYDFWCAYAERRKYKENERESRETGSGKAEQMA